MNATTASSTHAAGRAFDTVAKDYDRVFTQSLIGRSQRDAVSEEIARTFNPGDCILELNCGTGEDALFLSRRGMSVLACDASRDMIAVAKRRQSDEAPDSAIRFEVLPTESLCDLNHSQRFDGVLSNFAGLNCVDDLAEFARQLAGLVKPGGSALLCLCTRFCFWEIAWFLAHGKLGKAFRRCRGSAMAELNGVPLRVHYPTVRSIRSAMRPWFVLRSCKGIGVSVPPSYLEPWAQRHRSALHLMCSVDRVISRWPWLRVLADHVLLSMERTQA